jgi:hypothetical protein
MGSAEIKVRRGEVLGGVDHPILKDLLPPFGSFTVQACATRKYANPARIFAPKAARNAATWLPPCKLRHRSRGQSRRAGIQPRIDPVALDALQALFVFL